MNELTKYDPCKEALEFREQYGSFKEAWEACPKGDWMLWIAQKSGVDIKTLTKAKALCALTVRHLMKDQRSKDACIVALRFSKGKATAEELKSAAYAADAAAYAAYAADAAACAADAAACAADAAAADAAACAAVDAAAYAADAADVADAAAYAAAAADAAAYAAYAAVDAAAYAADAAAYAADAAAYAAYAAAYAVDAVDAVAYANAAAQNQKKTADICRKVLTKAVFEKMGPSLEEQQAQVINEVTKKIL